jgi:hypothetical protein
MGKSHNYYSFGILLLFVQMQIGYSQSIDKVDSICWRTGYKLQWSDFKGVPPEGNPWQAVCATEISANGYWEGKYPNYEVTHYFFSGKSWTKDTASTILLEHERLHFDIREVFARKIRLTVESLRNRRETKVSVYDIAIQSLLRQCKEWTELYDEETSHGLRPSKQREWAIKIQKELSALSKYATKCPPVTNTP